MGFFDKSYITTVSTVGSRLLDSKDIPNSVVNGAVEGIAKNGSIPEYVSEALVSSMGLRAESMYRYGDNKYTHGSPSGEIYSATQGTKEVLEVLRAKYGNSVSIDYCCFGLSNPLHVGWTVLMDVYGYDPEKNTLSGLKDPAGKPSFLKDLQVIISPEMANEQSTAKEQWGPPAKSGPAPSRSLIGSAALDLATASPVIVQGGVTDPRLLITYEWETTNPQSLAVTIDDAKLEIALPARAANVDYFHTRFLLHGKVKYEQFPVGTGQYPTLDEVFKKPLKPLGSFFPFLHLRYNKQAQNGDKASAAYKTSVKLADYIGVDFDQLVDGINKNPQITDVEQATLMLAVPVDTKDQMELRYLFDYFDKLHLAYPSQYQTPQLAALSEALNSGNFETINRQGSERTVKGATVIQDRLFAMSLHNQGIFKRLKAGNLGKVGTYATQIEKVTDTQSNGVDEDGNPITLQTEVTYYIFRKQLSDVVYEEVRVKNLSMNFYLSGNYVTSTNQGNAVAVVPIDNSITRRYSLPEREKLYSTGLHLIFNAKKVTELEWYQKPEFGTILKIIGVVILVYTWDPQWLAMASAVMSGTLALSAFVYAVAAALIEQLVIAYAIKIFVQSVGLEVALLAAIVAAAYGMYKLSDANWSLKLAPTAEKLLLAATGLAKGINNQVLTLMGELKDESDRFSLYTSEQEKKLKAANELLDSSNAMTPFVAWGESSSEYYERIFSGNVGILGIDAVSSYVDMALLLPKINQPNEG